MPSGDGHAGQLPPVPHHNATSTSSTALSPTRFLGRMSWEKGMLDTTIGASFRNCKDARPPAVPSTLAPLPEFVSSPTKHQALTPQPNSLRGAATPAAPHPSPTATKKQVKGRAGSRPMTMEESYNEVEKMLEEHMRQSKGPRPRRIEALDTASGQTPLSRHTFVFAPLDDPRMLSEIAAQEAGDTRDGEVDEAGGSSVKLKYFGPEARTSYYRTYRELHSKPQLFVDRNTHDHQLGSLRSPSVSGFRRSTGMRRSLPTLEQAQISVGGGEMNLVSAVPRSPRALFLGACLAGTQAAPTLLLRKEHNKRAFDFSHQGLGDSFIVRFAACLPELPLVECINVCDNRLTDAGISCLLRALENKPHLTSLDVSSNPIGVDAANVLRGYLRSNLCTLRVLTLNEVSLSDHECARLAKALQHNKSIERLLLRGNQVGLQMLATNEKTPVDDEEEDEDEDDGEKRKKVLTGGQAVGAMLMANLTLQHLDLSWNQLRATGTAFIAAALPLNYQLRELDLSYNSLGNKGALALARALRSGARLRRLTLSYNGISPRGGVGLASGLAVNSSLSMLILDGNPLGAQGGKALMHASCAPRPATSASASTVCQLSLQDCSLNVSAPTMSATGDVQLHVFNPTDPAGSYVLDLSDAYEHMVAHELFRLAISHPGRYHFTRLEYISSTQTRGQVTKLEMVKRRIQQSDTSPVEIPVVTATTSTRCQSLNPVTMLFRRLDEDGSGTVELSELVNVLRNCGLDVSDEQLRELLQKYDYDRNGTLQKREFADLFARVGFGFVDTDSSGSLDVDELRRVFQLLGVNEEAEINDAIAHMIAKYDLDGSGEIDAYEFLEFMTSEVFTVPDDAQKDSDSDEAKLMRLEPCEVSSGATWQIPGVGQLTADLAHSGGGADVGDIADKLQQQASNDTGSYAGETHRPSDSVLMTDAMLSRFLINATSISLNVTEQSEFLHTVLAESGMYLSSSQGEQLLARQGITSSAVRPGRRLAALARLLPRIVDHREAASLVTRVVDIHNQWLERLALRRWLGTQLYSILLGSLTNAYSFDLTRDDHRTALHRLALVAQEEKQFSRWRSGRADTSQSGNWENFRWATLDGEPVLLSSTYILNKLLAADRERTSLLAPPSKLVFNYVSTTRPPRGTKCLSQRRFEQLLAVLELPPGEKEISALCEDRRAEADQEQTSNSSSLVRTQALLHWELLRRHVKAQADEKRNKRKGRSIAGDTISRLTNTVEGLQQKLVLLEVLVTDRWLSSAQAQELVNAFPNAVRARSRAACLTFSRIVDLENFIQIYDSLSAEDQEECVRRLGWLNILDPLQPDRQYPPLDLSIHDERELVQILAQLALHEGTSCWKNASYRGSVSSAGGDQAEVSESLSVLPPPGWGRVDAVGPDSVKHHGTVCLRYHSGTDTIPCENDDTPQQETGEAERDAARLALRERALCGSRLFL